MSAWDESFAWAMDRVAESVLDGAQIYEPPVDAAKLAESLGLTIAWNEQQAGRASVVRNQAAGRTRGVILLRPDPRRERRHWAVAHEVGEQLVSRVLDEASMSPEELPPHHRELIANEMASRLLLPTAWFAADDRESDGDLLALKERYSTASHELIARRMLQLETPLTISIFDQGRLTFRRSNFQRRPAALGTSESEAHEAANATGLVQEQGDAWRVRAWPIHEPEWKREIVRSEWRYDVVGLCD